MGANRPWSDACERNKWPILEVLRAYLRDGTRVLEVGSGTGQHAVFFAAALPGVVWLTSDLSRNHAGIRCWLDSAGLANVEPPLLLDARAPRWPIDEPVDAVFSANTLHIMDAEGVRGLFRGAAEVLCDGGALLVYGPVSYSGRHVSESNARFDASLRRGDPSMGVRDLDDLNAFAAAAGLTPEADHEMPANNRLLVWRHRC